MANKNPKPQRVKNKDVVEIIARTISDVDAPAKAIKIILEDISDVNEVQLIAEDMLRSPWETLQEEGSVGEVNRVLALVSGTLKKLKLKPIVECVDADENSVEVTLPHSARRKLGMKKTHSFQNVSSVVDLIKEMEKRARYAE